MPVSDEKIPPKDSNQTQLPQTNVLGGSAAEPMPDRETSGGTNYLTASWKLVFKIGSETVQLAIGEPITVGRKVDVAKDADINFDLTPYGAYQGGVSRKHAVITFHNGALYIEDLGSTNGTRINGFQLTAKRKYRLRDGDEIEFARLRTSARFMRTE
jgi:pSer/pThr/pTyr-binding forkhead associated (FHA) protein